MQALFKTSKIWTSLVLTFLGLLAVFLLWPENHASAAVLSAVPEKKDVSVGETFTLQILLNTQNQSINTVDVRMSFPPDKLQVVSPSSGNSILKIYTTSPNFNNKTGSMEVAGGIQGGINVSSGLIATVTFRAKSPGRAIVRFNDGSKVLLNDGQGTNVLSDTISADISLKLPPPEGPIVYSDSHPDSDMWYKNKTVTLRWDEIPGTRGYSYTVSDLPTDIPDDVSEGLDTSLNYRSLPDGVHFFHIKALGESGWGGTTHFAFKIDTTAPASFPLDITPHNKTSSTNPVINFSTTDELSGLDHYELKIVSLNTQDKGQESLFFEASSPYGNEFAIGSYEIIVRAFDHAGNFTESSQKLEITKLSTWFFGRSGLEIPNFVTISWGALILILLGLLALLILIAWVIRHWHRDLENKVGSQSFPSHIQDQLEQLRKYQEKYGKLTTVLLLTLLTSSFLLYSYRSADAESVQLLPPTITSYSKEATDEELFLVSGRTDDPETEVVVNAQNTLLNEAFSFTVTSDKRGDWTFRSTSPMKYGNYIVWAQARIGEQLSPPSPQVAVTVHKVAFRLAGSRVTYLMAYMVTIGVLSGIIASLVLYILIMANKGRKRRKEFLQNLKLAEESIKRGFAILRRDIQAELALVSNSSLSPQASAEEKVRAEQLVNDLKYVEDYVGKEIWDTETFEGANPEEK